VLAGRANSDWVLNAFQGKNAKLILNGLEYQVRAERSSHEERNRAYQTFQAKYGSRIVKDWYSPSAVCLKLTPIGPALQKAVVKGEGEAEIDYDTWKLTNHDYYRGVAEAFDSASEEYDFTISRNFINTWIRRRSVNALLRLAKTDDVLVEIGCGTGTEAILIAPHVSQIIATDISDKMLQILRLKLRAKRLGEKILPVKAGASELSIVRRLVDGGQVDLVYSFNGALNCEPQMRRFVAELSALLKRGGYFVCSIRNTLCLSEALSHALVFQFGRMNPRKKQPIMVSVGGKDIPSVYYSARNFARFFTLDFRLDKQIALPGIMPPAYLNDYYLKLRDRMATLERLEPLLSERFPLKFLGDQTLFIFRKR
jgi:ubiquinone/menaquinone biosynthesis C-methylase UbiE